MTQAHTAEQLRWIKIDLHIHTPASEDYAEPDVDFLELLRETERRGLEIIAFTDHNTIAGYERMKQEVGFLEQLERTRRAKISDHQQLDEYQRLLRTITVLPGFEFTSHYGAHVIAIFPPTTSLSVLEATLLRLGVPPERLKQGATAIPNTVHVTEAYELITKAGGMVIAPHANGPNGVITESIRMGTSGQARVAATQSRLLAALEFVHFYTDHGTFTNPAFYNGKTEHYERRMFCIQGSDAHRVRRAPTGSDVGHRHGIGDRYFEALLPEPSWAALQSLFHSQDFERVRVPKRTQKEWDIDQLRFGVASERNVLRGANADPAQLLQDVVALCNMGGGTLVIGASTSATGVEGVTRPTEVSEQLRRAAEQFVEPAPMLSLELLRYESREVIRIEVRAPQPPPYVMDGQVWLRREAQTVTANRGELIQLARRALAQGVSSPLDNGQEWEMPRSGVEIVEAQRRNNEWVYEIRDLRTMPSVVRERAQGLWAYAIDRHADLRDGKVDLEGHIKWAGQLGLWRMYRQGNQVKYDLVHRDANGVIDHVFYGVTDWGLNSTWDVLLGQSVPTSEGGERADQPRPTAEVPRSMTEPGARPFSTGTGPLTPPTTPFVAPPAMPAFNPAPVRHDSYVPARQDSYTPPRQDTYTPPPNFGGRKTRWRGRGGLLRIKIEGAPVFDLAMSDAEGATIQPYPNTPRDKLTERWLALIVIDRPQTGIEVMGQETTDDGATRLTFRDLRTSEVSTQWRVEELKEGSLREYAARMYNTDRHLDEDTVRWWGNLGYHRPMRSQVDLVYRDAEGVDHFYYACRREELRGEWRSLLEAWDEPTETIRNDARPLEAATWAERAEGRFREEMNGHD